ncbi:hypothetical protein ACN47E_007971 [Coniothyrium glycines]
MRFSTLAATLTSVSLASARIIGIAAPSTLAPNTTFPLTLLTENYIQTVADIAVAYGFQLPTDTYPTGFPFTLGSFTASSYLGANKSNTLTNVTVQAVASDLLEGDNWYGKDVVLTAGVYSLYGASGSTTLTGFNVTVTIGDETSEDVVTSQGQGWITSGNN